MIHYNSHHWITLLRIRGSVFPRSLWRALPVALVAYLLKRLEREGKPVTITAQNLVLVWYDES